jgi:hypothetical protein
MFTLKEMFDFERTINFLNQGVNGTIVVICTINNSEEFIICDALPSPLLDSKMSLR